MSLETFARSILPLVVEYYKDPKNAAEFERWKKERDEKRKEENSGKTKKLEARITGLCSGGNA